MIEIDGHLAEREVWGWPWHGRPLKEFVGGIPRYSLQRHDGAIWPLYDDASHFLPEPMLSAMGSYAALRDSQATDNPTGAITHLVRVAGHEWPGRTPEQVVADASKSQEWLGEALLANNRLYMQALEARQWIFSHAGKRWLMRYTASPAPRPVTAVSTELRVTLEAKVFGEFGAEASAWETVAVMTAPSCCTAGFQWFTPQLQNPAGGLVLPQSIRSDGGVVILEAHLFARPPARLQRGAYGFYRLDIARVDDAWSCSLTLLLKDEEIYTKTAPFASPLTQGRGLLSFAATYPAPNTVVLTYELLDEPYQSSALEYVGTIQQEQIRHLGFVFEADDVLHEMKAVYRVQHDCNVPMPEPTFGGERTIVEDGSGNVISDVDTTWYRYEAEAAVTTVMTVEVLRDGTPVASTSAVMQNSKSWYDHVTHPTPGVGVHDRASSMAWQLEIGDYLAASSTTLDDKIGGDVGAFWLWPDTGIFQADFFSTISAEQIVPWPRGWLIGGMTEQAIMGRQHNSNGTTSFTNGYRITLGAARLANNVWVPCITAGMPAGYRTWNQLTGPRTYTVVTGMPSTAFGARVGPDVNGQVPAGWLNAGTAVQHVESGSYDFLHRTVLPYGAIF